MIYISSDTDKQVLHYQKTKDSEALLTQYKNFLNKYQQMIVRELIDYTNYDLRYFLSCYMKDPEDIKAIRRGKYHSQDIKNKAQKIVFQIRQVFHQYTSDEVYNELVIPFLECAKSYKVLGNSFQKYLYGSYRYNLKRHIDQLSKSTRGDQDLFYYDAVHGEGLDLLDQIMLQEDHSFNIEIDTDLALNNPDWVNGKICEYPFDELSREERLILAKYYYENYTDKEIGQLIGRNPKSIARIRNRLKKKFIEKQQRGEFKWIRM